MSLFSSLLFSLLIPAAQAAFTCSAGSAPSTWSSADCDPITSGSDICTHDSGTNTWTCDVSGAGGDSTVIVVEDYDTSSNTFEAWGDWDGTNFCCQIDANNYSVDTIEIIGSDYSDSLQFTSDSLTYNLNPIGQGSLDGQIDAGDGLDSVYGSNNNSSSYSETLNGEDKRDTIRGHGGDDIINGGGGDDTLSGGNDDDTIDGDGGDDTIDGNSGDDTLYGGVGSDTMTGGPDDDIMYGEDGADRMSGNDGDDDIDGGAGGDIMCGGSEVYGDIVTDGDAVGEALPDQIWSAVSADSVTCGHSSTYWDGAASSVGCTGNPTLTNKPTACP